jgi:hypothetical protein
MDSSYDELLHDYKLKQKMIMKSLEAGKGLMVLVINAVQKNSKAKDGEMQRPKEQRLSKLYTDFEYITHVSNQYAPDEQ